MSVLIAFLSLAVEAELGYPDRLFAAIGHPVTWIGSLISCLDKALNRATDSDRTRRLCGVAALAVIVAVPALVGYALEWLLLSHALGLFVLVAIATTLLAQKSLSDHVEAVARGLDDGLPAGRDAVWKPSDVTRKASITPRWPRERSKASPRIFPMAS